MNNKILEVIKVGKSLTKDKEANHYRLLGLINYFNINDDSLKWDNLYTMVLETEDDLLDSLIADSDGMYSDSDSELVDYIESVIEEIEDQTTVHSPVIEVIL